MSKVKKSEKQYSTAIVIISCCSAFLLPFPRPNNVVDCLERLLPRKDSISNSCSNGYVVVTKRQPFVSLVDLHFAIVLMEGIGWKSLTMKKSLHTHASANERASSVGFPTTPPTRYATASQAVLYSGRA